MKVLITVYFEAAISTQEDYKKLNHHIVHEGTHSTKIPSYNLLILEGDTK